MNPRQIADRLVIAEREVKSIAPFTDEYPDLDVDTAYEIQDMTVGAHLDAGETLIGAKLGLTSRAKQEAMGVSDPLYGWLTSGMVHDGSLPVPLGRLIHPRVEPEIAFLLAREVSTPATITSVLAATDCVFGAAEVLDSRYTDFRFTLPDVIADNASSARFVMGEPAHPSELEDLRLVGCVLRRQGEVVATAVGSAVMGHPAAAVAWLVNRLEPRGRVLPAGSIILSGGLTAPVPLVAGQVISAEFEGLGSVEVFA